jgi:predicted GTPase
MSKRTKTLLAASLVCLFAFTSCDKEKAITVEQLPAAAQSYLQTTYPGVKVLFVKEESELFSTEYKVQLENRMEVKFDSDGVPIDVDMD